MINIRAVALALIDFDTAMFNPFNENKEDVIKIINRSLMSSV